MIKGVPGIETEDMEVDNCAMRIVMKPEQFSVIFAENANGDILSDVSAGGELAERDLSRRQTSGIPWVFWSRSTGPS